MAADGGSGACGCGEDADITPSLAQDAVRLQGAREEKKMKECETKVYESAVENIGATEYGPVGVRLILNLCVPVCLVASPRSDATDS